MIIQPIQILFLLVICIVIGKLIVRFKKNDIKVLEFVLWLLFWLIAFIIILLPQTTSFLARVLGIGRGADLVIYISLIILFYIAFRISVRLEKIERNIAKIIRKIALKDKENKR